MSSPHAPGPGRAEPETRAFSSSLPWDPGVRELQLDVWRAPPPPAPAELEDDLPPSAASAAELYLLQEGEGGRFTMVARTRLRRCWLAI